MSAPACAPWVAAEPPAPAGSLPGLPAFPCCPPLLDGCDPDGDGLPPGLPWAPLSPGCGEEAEPPAEPEDEDGELLDDPLLPEGEEDGEGMPPDEPGEPELPLDGELGIGIPGLLGWLTVACVRQPDSNAATSAAVAVRNLLWPNIHLPPTARGPRAISALT